MNQTKIDKNGSQNDQERKDTNNPFKWVGANHKRFYKYLGYKRYHRNILMNLRQIKWANFLK